MTSAPTAIWTGDLLSSGRHAIGRDEDVEGGDLKTYTPANLDRRRTSALPELSDVPRCRGQVEGCLFVVK